MENRVHLNDDLCKKIQVVRVYKETGVDLTLLPYLNDGSLCKHASTTYDKEIHKTQSKKDTHIKPIPYADISFIRCIQSCNRPPHTRAMYHVSFDKSVIE